MPRFVLLLIASVLMSGCAHSRPPSARVYVIAEDAGGVGSSLGTGGSGFRDCDAEQNTCFSDCWNADPLPYPHTKRDGWLHEHCTRKCRELYIECERSNEKKSGELKFSRADEAVEWIKNHKAEVALGTVVIIAGTAFVVTTGGFGSLILAPLAL
ncbi:hypothetical protein [Cystobacter fuscus]|uniref:hypothetical protein n=1 Tax=Cystobacter fuscus TaxID=43 RepID=UPI001FE0905D|nr:hypothetical protein [Cystobacter fuscus]